MKKDACGCRRLFWRKYADVDEMRRDLYQREYTALCELEKII